MNLKIHSLKTTEVFLSTVVSICQAVATLKLSGFYFSVVSLPFLCSHPSNF